MAILLLVAPFKEPTLNYAAFGVQFFLSGIFFLTIILNVFDEIRSKNGVDAASSLSMKMCRSLSWPPPGFNLGGGCHSNSERRQRVDLVYRPRVRR